MFRVGKPGAHWVSNALAVLAAVDAVGGDLALAGLALAELGGLPGRGARFAVPRAERRGAGDRRKLQRQPGVDAAALAVLGGVAGDGAASASCSAR